MKVSEMRPIEHGTSPRLQIIRGLPGSGKTTLARQYPCLIVENDLCCLRAGSYWDSEYESDHTFGFADCIVRNALREGGDLVVAGFFPKLTQKLTTYLYWAMAFGFESWVYDTGKSFNNRHCIPWPEMERLKEQFVPFSIAGLQKYDRYNKELHTIHMGMEDDKKYREYIASYVHKGLMPNTYF